MDHIEPFGGSREKCSGIPAGHGKVVVLLDDPGHVRVLFNNGYSSCTGSDGAGDAGPTAALYQKDIFNAVSAEIPGKGKGIFRKTRFLLIERMVQDQRMVAVFVSAGLGGEGAGEFEAQPRCKPDVRAFNAVDSASQAAFGVFNSGVGELNHLAEGFVGRGVDADGNTAARSDKNC